MLDPPKTLKEAQKYRYNQWAGNPKGNAYNEKRCAYAIRPSMEFQCSRKNKHGPDNLYCKQHAKIVED